MFRVSSAVACALALPIVALAAAARADLPYDAVRAGIDKRCDDLAKPRAHVPVVYLERLDVAGGPGPWRRTTADGESRAVDAAGYPGGSFAIVRGDDSALSASLVRREPSGDVGRSQNWCFVGDGLSRAGAEFVDLPRHLIWRRTQYQDSSIDPAGRDIIRYGALGAPLPKKIPSTPLDRLVIDPIARPQDLPFYAAYRAARGHL